MMQIYIQHQGQQIGPLSPDHVRAGLANGTYQLSDLAWYEGASGWLPLSTVPGMSAMGPSGPLDAVPPPLGSTPTSTLATWSLVLGILSFFSFGLTALPAIICGHLARRDIKRSSGARSGSGLALAGLITGYSVFGLAVLVVGLPPQVIPMNKKGDLAEAVNNARSFGLGLTEFKYEFGAFPDDATAAAIVEVTDTDLVVGSSSNARFRQLIRSGVVKSELIFYAKSEGSRRPDDQFKGDLALEKGECGFAYVDGVLTADDVPRPLAMAPFVPGTDRFDHQPFNDRAVILWTDGAVKIMPIDRAAGRVMLDGVSLLDPSHPIWGGKPPVIALPE